MSNDYLKSAQIFSVQKLSALQESLTYARTLIKDVACVYATGSFGRLEAGPESDLDLFIVSDMGKKHKNGHEIEIRLLSGIDEIKLQYHLIVSAEKNELPEFDGDGKFLECHSFDDFVSNLGGPNDDASNTMTGRLLLLLESKPLLGSPVYDRLVDHVIARYFIDFDDNPTQFVPAFLFNDILRMWRTFCVNYEHRRKVGSQETKIKNLKLKYSRMLTCYSALLFLLDVHSANKTVSQADVRLMIGKTPTERLLAVKGSNHGLTEADSDLLIRAIDSALLEYSEFLQFTHQDKTTVVSEYVADPQKWRSKSYEFGKSIEQAMSVIGRSDGESSTLYRMMLI